MKKILLSVGMIALVAAVAVGATTAFFSDTETSEGNTFTAGAIDLEIDNTSYLNGEFNEDTSWTLTDLVEELFFDFDDIKPGDWGEDTISIHVFSNPAWVCADVTLTQDNENDITEPEADLNDTDEEGELDDELYFAWWADDGDNVYEEGEEIISEGVLGNANVNQTVNVTLADSNTNIWTGNSDDPVDGSTTYYVAKLWCFGELNLSTVDQDGDFDPQNPNGPDQPGRSDGVDCDGELVTNISQSDGVKMDIAFRAIQSRNNDDFICQQT